MNAKNIGKYLKDNFPYYCSFDLIHENDEVYLTIKLDKKIVISKEFDHWVTRAIDITPSSISTLFEDNKIGMACYLQLTTNFVDGYISSSIELGVSSEKEITKSLLNSIIEQLIDFDSLEQTKYQGYGTHDTGDSYYIDTIKEVYECVSYIQARLNSNKHNSLVLYKEVFYNKPNGTFTGRPTIKK